jgi:hypothetical protein
MNDPADDIAQILAGDSSLGLTIASNLFVGHRPTDPPNAVSVQTNPGGAPTPQFDLRRMEVTVYFRGARGTYRETWDLANRCLEALRGVHNLVLNGSRYILINPTTDVWALGQDAKGHEFFQFMVRILRAAAA